MSQPADRLEQRLHAIRAARAPHTTLTIRRGRGRLHIDAFISTAADEAFRDITIRYDPRWPWRRHHELTDYCRTVGSDDALATALHFILHHEIEHHVSCPGNIATGTRLHQSVAAALRPFNKVTLTQYTVNLIADILVNHATTQREQQPAGIVIDWYDQATAPQSWPEQLTSMFGRQPVPHPFEPSFAVFIATQLQIFGDLPSAQLLAPYLQLDATMQQATDELTAALRDPALIDRRDDWPALFAQCARLLAPFLPRTPPPLRRPQPMFQPANPRDAAESGEDSYYDQRRGEVIPVGGSKRADARALDWWYREAAEQLPIRQITARPPARLTLLSTLQLSDAAVALLTDRTSIDSVILLLDSSGSMFSRSSGKRQNGIVLPWSTDCTYHQAVHLLYRLQITLLATPAVRALNVMTFAGRTRTSGWFAPDEWSTRALDALFGPSLGNGTRLDLPLIEAQLTREHTLLVILSDGEISNISEVCAFAAQQAARATVILIRIGAEAAAQPWPPPPVIVRDAVSAAALDELIIDEISLRIDQTAGTG